jgi:N-acylneuraminate cytidylyltransferase
VTASTTPPRGIAFIPARAGSKRVPGKNVRSLAGHPLIAYSVAAALESRVFAAVMVSTDSEAVAEVARHYGAEVPFLRPAEYAGDLSPDIEWLEHALTGLSRLGREYDCFSILRPTSPFRTAHTIRRAWEAFTGQEGADSLRAVEKCAQHPAKMWVLRGPPDRPRMLPLLPFGPCERPWHSTPYQSLPEVFIQNASLEIAWTRVVREGRTIAGETVVPFVSRGAEGFDINRPEDWRAAEEMLRDGAAVLPKVPQEPWRG